MNTSTEASNTVEHARLEMNIDRTIAVITLSDEAKRNALSRRLLEAFIEACRECERQQVRAMILKTHAQSGVWSSGHDIEELPCDGHDPLSPKSPLEKAIRTLRCCPFPVIALVQGSVWGGAVELMASCDIVIADERACFAVTPAKIGLPYNITGLQHFNERLSYGAIKRLFFIASPIRAEEALRVGLIDEVVPATHIEEHAMDTARQIARNAPLAVTAVKQQLRLLSDGKTISVTMVEKTAEVRCRAYQAADYREGIVAFRERRPPQFTGKA